MICMRNINNTRIQYAMDSVIAPPASIQIATTDRSLTTFFNAVYPPLPQPSRNVGEIVSSLLTESQFFQLHDRSDWVIADGREVLKSSAYYRLSGKDHVPDLRGMFLRGANHNRESSTGNPYNDSELGSYHADYIRSHDHKYKFKRARGGIGNISAYDLDNPAAFLYDNVFKVVDENERYFQFEDELQRETRPINVIVNFFIKIN